MTDDFVRPAPRRNTPLAAMVVVGTAITVGGLFAAILCYSTILSGSLNVALVPVMQVASSLAGFGFLLLFVAWIIAAARYK